jgi:DNA polymerase-3 subunit gamma/tau
VSYQVFARKYRPKTFDDVLGQDHVVRTLRNAIEQKRLAHAYLFVGPRGTGKTSTARILAKALNCTGGPKADFDPDEDVCVEIAEGRSLDVLEIDGASNNGVEQVRELRETVRFAPARGQFKIYYIDEVHMLSNAAFNALLKTLEEPPPHVKFIFATTEANKILPTILSRCQRFDLRPIPTELIAKHLLHIANNEGVALDDAAAWAVAKGADGGMRDAQSMLDQLVAFCGNHITEANVLDVFGFTSREKVAQLATALLARDTPAALSLIQKEAESGRELSQLLGELIGALRALLVAKLDPSADGDGIPADLWQSLVAAADAYPPDRILAAIDVFAETEGRMKWSTNRRLHFELGLIKAIQVLGEVRLSDVIKVLGRSAGLLGDAPLSPAAPAIPAVPAPAPVVAAAPAVEATATPAPEPEPIVTEPVQETQETVAAPVEDVSTPPWNVEETPEPAPAPQPEPARAEPAAPKKNTSDSFADRFASLIESAPEHSEPPPPPEPVAKAEPAPTPAKEPAPAKEAKPADESFYNDPLIEQALVILEGKVVG